MNTIDEHSDNMTDAAYRDICESTLHAWKQLQLQPVKTEAPPGGLHYGTSLSPTSSSRALNKSLELVNKKIQNHIESVVAFDVTPEAEAYLRQEIHTLQDHRDALIAMLGGK